MGKAKRNLKHSGGAGAAPRSPPAAPAPAAQEQQDAPVQRVPAVKKLRAEAKPKERLQGCLDCAALALEPGGAPALIRSDAPAALIRCMEDSRPQVRVAACRALRNLLLCAGPLFAQTMAAPGHPGAAQLRGLFAAAWQELARLRGAGVTPTAPADSRQESEAMAAPKQGAEAGEEVMEEDEEEEPPAAEEAGEGVKMYCLGEFLSELAQLLGALVHNSQGATAAFSDGAAIGALASCILMPECGGDQPLSVAASDCLLTLAEDNEAVIAALRALPAEIQQGLLGVLRSKAVSPTAALTQASVAGVLCQADPALLPEVVGVLAGHLAAAPAPRGALQKLQPLLQQAAQSENHAHKQLRKAALRQLSDQLSLALACAQTLANIVSSAEGACDGEADDEAIFATTPLGGLLRGQGAQTALMVAAKAVELCTDTPGEEYDQQPLLSDAKKLFGSVRAAAVTLLMNMLIVLPCSAFGDAAALWTGLCAAHSRAAARRPEGDELRFLAATAQCLWTMVRKGAVPPPAVAEAVRPVCQSAQGLLGSGDPEAEEVVINILGLLGAAGQRLSNDQGVQRACLVAVTELCTRCLYERPLGVNLEAMNTVIDVFADDQWDDVMREKSLLRQLQMFAPALEKKVQALAPSGGVPEDLLPRLEVVSDNIGPFIEYKADRGL
eukprot:TRINITY_DN60130_c0_g1_i1.p1 TRINITY_DN60130_c0_g1~~TRINITY_DN60130_c0_g1_i1.p1  ORF type:complete len:694 (+),score=249.97 TRINITY_DN60130_c0_g1_i1:76-2082(+)